MVQPSNLPNKHSAGGGADTNRLVTQSDEDDDDDLKGDANEDSDGDGGDDYDYINCQTCPINTQ